VIGLPPSEPGGEKTTSKDTLRLDAPTSVGAPGTVATVATFDVADGALVPAAFLAVTVHL